MHELRLTTSDLKPPDCSEGHPADLYLPSTPPHLLLWSPNPRLAAYSSQLSKVVCQSRSLLRLATSYNILDPSLTRPQYCDSKMDHFPRLRRKKDVPSPTIITPNSGTNIASKVASPLGDPQPVPSPRPLQKLSPFRVFHRSSGKRARDSPPASLPHSPAAAAVLAPDAAVDRPVSPLSLKTDPSGEDEQKHTRPPKIPSFLDLSLQGSPTLHLLSQLPAPY